MKEKLDRIKIDYPNELEIEQSIKKVSGSMKKKKMNLRVVIGTLVAASIALFFVLTPGSTNTEEPSYALDLELKTVSDIQVAEVTIPKGEYEVGDYVYLTLDSSSTGLLDKVFLTVKADTPEETVGIAELDEDDVKELKVKAKKKEIELYTDEPVTEDELVTNIVTDGKVFTSNASERAQEVANENAAFNDKDKFYEKKAEIAAKKLEKESVANAGEEKKLQNEFAKLYRTALKSEYAFQAGELERISYLLNKQGLTEDELAELEGFKNMLENSGLKSNNGKSDENKPNDNGKVEDDDDDDTENDDEQGNDNSLENGENQSDDKGNKDNNNQDNGNKGGGNN